MDPYFHVVYAKFFLFHSNVAAEVEIRQTKQGFLIFYCLFLPIFSEL